MATERGAPSGEDEGEGGRGGRGGGGAPRIGRMIGAIIYSVQPIVMNAISVPVSIYVIRKIGPTDWGQWSTATGLIQVVAVFMSLGLRGQFVRAVARDPGQARDLMAEQIGLRFLLGLFAAGLALLIAFGLHYPPTVLACTALAAAGLIASGVAVTAVDLFQATDRLPLIASVGMVQGLSSTLAAATAVTLGAGPVGLGFAYLVGPITWLIVSFSIVNARDFPVRVRWRFGRFWGHLKEARYLAAQQVLTSVGRNAEALIAPKLVGMTRYGLFSAGTMLADRMAAVPDGMGGALYPVVAATHPEDPGRAAREVGTYLTLALALCVPICVLSMFVAPRLGSVLFPDEAGLCARVIRITIWSLPLMSVDVIMNYALNAAGKEASQTRAVLISNLVTLGATVALVGRFGLAGACLSWVIRQPIFILFRASTFLETFRGGLVGVPVVRIALANLALALVFLVLHPGLWSVLPPVVGKPSIAYWTLVLGLLSLEGTLGLGIYALFAFGLKIFGEAELKPLLAKIKGRFSRSA